MTLPISRGLPTKVPFRVGTIPFKNLEPGSRGNGYLSSGRWMLSTLSTLPYVGVDMGAYGSLIASWGDVIDVPAGLDAIVTNQSAHLGDAVFNAVGEGLGSMVPPHAITVPAFLFEFPGAPLVTTALRTKPVDTRRARACHLYFADIFAVAPAPSSITYKIFYSGGRRGRAYGPPASKPFLEYTQTSVGYILSIPLGYGSGANREPAPGANSLPETRPMALLDSLFVQFTIAQATAVAMSTATDCYYVLEY